jgi:CDP-diacylglycerol---glycerol-3-phosphate 3-phosphatidyltransferase|tara:strand:+ start:3664 stop:4203 length:540 start_codon:yes stop_codon:yes gene_type:complete
MTLASYITCSRIVLILPILYLTSFEQIIYNFLALAIFLIAGTTDYIDGYIARKTNTESSFGALLDLLADKLLVCIVLVWLVKLNTSLIFVVPVLIIILRELIISSVRQFVVEKEGINKMEVSLAGKSKTTIQFIAVSLIIISPGMGFYFSSLGLLVLWLAALVSLYSLYGYLVTWKKFL